jgi:hypothetical protein
MKCKLFIIYIYSIVVDDVDGGQEPEPEVHMATAVEPPAPANSARSNKDESDARIKQIQVNKLSLHTKCLMTLTGGLQHFPWPYCGSDKLPPSHFGDPCGQNSAGTGFSPVEM